MSEPKTSEFYDQQYGLHRDGKIVCQNSVHDLDKAQRRVKNMLRAFRISNLREGAEILDVGCGLGYYSSALAAATGAKVTGIDLSQVGVNLARTAFPNCEFRCAAWPHDIERVPRFDLIWAVDFSVINTFDLQVIRQQFVEEAMVRLKPGGSVVVGWSTDFSGQAKGNWSHWSVATLKEFRTTLGFSAPMVAETTQSWVSYPMIQAGRLMGRSLPIFMVRKKGL